jgi:hypothetical protein
VWGCLVTPAGAARNSPPHAAGVQRLGKVGGKVYTEQTLHYCVNALTVQLFTPAHAMQQHYARLKRSKGIHTGLVEPTLHQEYKLNWHAEHLWHHSDLSA